MSAGAARKERELKFRCDDLDGLRGRLVELEAERQQPSGLEENEIFDLDGQLESAGSLLRLRQDGRGTRLTFKGPATFEGEVKVRHEHEITVDDAEQARALIESLGYRRVGVYQKYREEWLLGGVIIALDHTPIGGFAEFEGEGAERVADRCRFSPADAERRNYAQLYKDYRKQNADAPADMVFP